MNLHHFIYAGFTALGLTLGLTACSNQSVHSSTAPPLTSEKLISDFESASVPNFIHANNGDLQLVDDERVIHGEHSLLVSVKTQKNNNAALILKPQKAWDWSLFSDFNLAFDVGTPGTESLQIDLIIEDKNGDAYTRALVVPVGAVTTWYAKMDGHDQFDPNWATKNEFNFESGFRSNPPTWQGSGKQVFSLWGKKHLDLSGITKISFVVSGLLSDREFTIPEFSSEVQRN